MNNEQKVKIRLFGAFRKFGNGQNIELSMPESCTVSELKNALSLHIADLPGGSAGKALVFESALADENSVLSEDALISGGKILAILPPVCGG